MTNAPPLGTSPETTGLTGPPALVSAAPAAKLTSQTRELLQRLLVRTGITVVALAIILGIWQATVSVFGISPLEVPSVADTWTALHQNFSTLMDNTQPTAIAALLGFAVSAVIGVPIGYVLSKPGRLVRGLNTGMIALQIFPKVCIAPLFVVWFGFGYLPKVLFIFLMGFFPIVLNSSAGFSSVPRDLDDLVSVIGFGPLQRLRRIHGPWALPQIFTGLKISASFITIATIAAEWVGAEKGLGVLITQAQGNQNMALAFAAVFVVAVIGFAIYGAVALIEMFAIPWHVSRRRQQ